MARHFSVLFAGDETVRIAAAESIACQLFRRSAISFLEQRRYALRVRLILEAVNEVFGRELIRGVSLVSQQIVYRVVVLAVREPAHDNRGWLSWRHGWRLRHSRFRRGLSQVAYPFEQQRLLRGAGRDEFPTGVLYAKGRLEVQQRLFRPLAIHQRREAPSEGLDLCRRRIRFGKMQPGG